MTKLTMLSNDELSASIQSLVNKEREILTDILHHLCEIENRKLHLEAGYGSMFQYAVQSLGYSEAQAYRRISAMRLLKEIPEIEIPLKTGSLNLTQLTQAREHFKSEAKKSCPLSAEEKLTLISSLENKTTRETEKIFAELDPEKIPIDKERVIRRDLTEIRFVASDTLMAKLKRFKDLDSHVQKDPNYAELFERLVDLALEAKVLNAKKRKDRTKVAAKVNAEFFVNASTNASTNAPMNAPMNADLEVNVNTVVNPDAAVHANVAVSATAAHSSKFTSQFSAPKKISDGYVFTTASPASSRSRAIPIFVKRVVTNRDEASCSFQNPVTGKRCGSTYRLQFDHILPFAKAGDHSVKNIRILCQNHNLWQAEKQFGREKMSRYH